MSVLGSRLSPPKGHAAGPPSGESIAVDFLQRIASTVFGRDDRRGDGGGRQDRGAARQPSRARPAPRASFPSWASDAVRRMFRAWRWRGRGLGREEQGVRAAVDPVVARGCHGIGYVVDRCRERTRRASQCQVQSSPGTGPGPPLPDAGPPKRRRLSRPWNDGGVHQRRPVAGCLPAGGRARDIRARVLDSTFLAPAWVLACVAPALRLVNKFDGDVCGPLHSDVAGVRAWRSLGIRHVGVDGPQLFIFQPQGEPASWPVDLHNLRGRRCWAALVPTPDCRAGALGEFEEGELMVIHIGRFGAGAGATNFSWVLRGAPTSNGDLLTRDGAAYWSADGRFGPFAPSDIGGLKSRTGAGRPAGCLASVPRFDNGRLLHYAADQAPPLACAVKVTGGPGVASVREITLRERRWDLLLSTARSQKSGERGVDPSILAGIAAEWRSAVDKEEGALPLLDNGGFAESLRTLRGAFDSATTETARSMALTFCAVLEDDLARGSGNVVRSVLVAAALVVRRATEAAGRVAGLAARALLCPSGPSKHILRAGRFCLTKAAEADVEAAVRSLAETVAACARPPFGENVRFILASFLTSDAASAALRGCAHFERAVSILAPTPASPTGVFVYNDGPVAPPPREGRRSILLWNVDGLKARRSEVLRLLSQESPTVAVFCETKRPAESIGADKDFLTSVKSAGYPHIYANSCTRESVGPWNFGVMIISSVRPDTHSFGIGHDTLDREGRSVTVRFADFTLVGGYSPCTRPGEGVSQRRVDYESAMRLHLLREKDQCRELVYAGDLNVVPTWADADVVDLSASELEAAPGCSESERRMWTDLLSTVGLFDVYRHHCPEPSHFDFTWRSRQPRRPAEARGHRVPAGMRIDFFLATAGALEASRSCSVLRDFGSSDHRPVVMVIGPAQGMECGDLGRSSVALADYGAGAAAASVFSKLARCSMVAERGQPPPLAGPSENDGDGGCSDGEDGGESCAVVNDWPCDVEAAPSPWVPLHRECPTVRAVFKALRSRDAGRVTAPLVDSGSAFSLVTESFLAGVRHKKRNARWRTPVFTLADGTCSSPSGLARLFFGIGGARFGHDFWVMQGGPTDVILGSDFLGEHGGRLDYATREVSLLVEGKRRVTLPFDSGGGLSASSTAWCEAAAPLYARETVTLRPMHHHFVPVATSKCCHVDDGAWGVVLASPTSSRFVCARGVATLARGSNWVQLCNVTNEPVVVRAGAHVADFHRQDRGMFDIREWDLDVEERVTAALRAERCRRVAPVAAATSSHPCTGDDDVERAFSDPASRLSEITFGEEVVSDPAALRGARSLIYRYKHLWNAPDFRGGEGAAKHDVTCSIELEAPFTSKARVRSVSPTVRDTIAKEVAAQRDAGIIEPSASPYASTVLLVPKSDGSVRFCIDYRALNAVTKKDGYLMPRVDDSLAALNGSRFFTSLDLTAAFNQIPMDEKSKDLTSFSTPDGTFRYNRMPFGLINGPAVFHRFIDNVMSGLKWSVCMVYMDDVLVYSKTFAEHLAALDSVFARVDDNGLRFKAKKCYVGVHEVKFLGHVVCRDGIKPDPDKTKAIREMPIPADAAEMRSALGLFGYYRKFCCGFSTTARPLNDAVLKGSRLPKGPDGRVKWSEDQLNAFESLRSVLIAEPVLAHPDWDRPFVVHTDWCKSGIGAVLSQEVDGVERVVCYASRALKDHEQKYAAYEGECLAVIWAASLWYSTYLYGRRFTVVTDHEALTWLFTKAPNQSRVQKWIIMMQDLSFDTKHRKGSRHGNADGLSRLPLPDTSPYGEEPVEPLYGSAPPISCSVTPTPTAGAVGGRAYFPPEDKEAWTDDEWKALQERDKECAAITAIAFAPASLRNGGRVRAAGKFSIVNGVLHYLPSSSPGARVARRRERNRGDYTAPRRVVPRCLRMFILRRHHGLPLSGHAGRTRVYAAISARFWWKGMYADVKRWVRACSVCCRRKTPRPVNAGVPATVTSPYPFHTVCIDIMGPLPETANGNRWILTMSDRFTRWPIAVPLRDTKAPSVCDALFTSLLAVHGCPLRILSDRGSQLVSAAVKYMCKRWGIRKVETTGYQPQSNPVERFHRYLNSAMTALHGNFGLDWDRYVDAAVFTYRVSINDATGYSPFFLLYGRECVSPADIFLGSGPQEEFKSETEYATAVGSSLARAYQNAHEAQVRAAEINLAYRSDLLRKAEFFPGQKVFYWQPGASAAGQLAEGEEAAAEREGDSAVSEPRGLRALPGKWKFKWTGPHVIVGVHGDRANVYVVCHRKTGKEFLANVNRLSPFHPWSDDPCDTADGVRDASNSSFAVGGRAQVGDLIAFPLEGTIPFGVGRLISRDVSGDLHFQWLSNNKDSMTSPLHLGWRDERDRRVVYAAAPPAHSRRHYVALTDEHYDMGKGIRDLDVLAHGFDLDRRGRVPMDVLKTIAASDLVDWAVPDHK